MTASIRNRIIMFVFCLQSSFMFSSNASYSQDMMVITFEGTHILSSDVFQFSIFDRVCNRDAGVITLKGNGRATIKVCRGGTGHGNIIYKNITLNSQPIGVEFVREDDPIRP